MSLPPIDPGQPYWDVRMETLPPEQRQLLRAHRLHWQLRRCWDGSPFYRARLQAAGLDPDTFGGLAEWPRLPILHQTDLPDTPDWAVAPEAWWDHRDEIPGVPPRIVTDGDAIHQADLAARALWAAGARPGYPLPIGDIGPSTSRSPTISAGEDRIGAGRDDSALDVVPVAVWTDAWPHPRMPATVRTVALGAPLVATTLGYTCPDGGVLHWNDDHFLIEIVDPVGGQPVPAGAAGAVAVTDLAREGSPLLRFWTGLEATLVDEPCPCGRTSMWSRSVQPLS